MKQVIKCLQRCGILAVITFFSGCSVLAPVNDKTPAKYVLFANSKSEIQSKPTNKVLLVSEPKAAPGYDSSKMVYLKEPYHLQNFVKHEWVDTPALLLQPLIVESLRESQHFKAVVTPPFSGLSNLRLDTEIVQLQQNFIRNPSEVEFVINAQIINADTRHVIAIQRFAYSVPAVAGTPYAGVYATNQAVNDFLKQLAQFVVSHT